MAEIYDAVVVGGGPAGLAAGLWLARYRRRVIVLDADDPRNAATWAVHGYFGIRDPAPAELRELGREQAMVAGAEVEHARVSAITGEIDDFSVRTEDGRELRARRILLATGLLDIKPEIPGFDEFYGTSIWHCPDCDGPGVTDRRVGVIGWGTGTARLCLYLLTWTDQLMLFTHSHPTDMPTEAMEALERHGIAIRREAIERLDGRDGSVRRVVLHGAPAEEVDALFFHVACGPGSTLAAELGCELVAEHADEGILQVDENSETTVPGVYAAGDITPGMRLVIRAASEGVRAALGIHRSLIPADRRF
jgi:thioredoxin reductase